MELRISLVFAFPAAFLHCWAATNSPAPLSVSSTDIKTTFHGIRFGVGFTNAAVFNLTNPGPSRVVYRIHSLEYLSPSGWRTNAAISLPPQNAQVIAKPWESLSGLLKPFGSTDKIVAVPMTNMSWRLCFECIEQADGVKGAIHKTKDAVSEITTGAKSLTMGGRKYFIFTETVSK